ncbi:MAG TPA: cytochrome c peroxidase [Sphingobium sp.]|uniref:cytochrome-c peroxidase n=1 Tax=Sphingobium sp. TaxID=1912891 RepID=UPI002ED0C8E6
MNQQPNMPIAVPDASPKGRSRKGLRIFGGAGALLLLGLAGASGYLLAYPEKAPVALHRLIEDVSGANPHPVTLMLPVERPMSAFAKLGAKIFHDRSLSGSGQQSCATCHSPEHSFGPPDGRDTELGGVDLRQQGLRPPPSLTYLYRQTGFTIGPVTAEADDVISFDQLAQQAQTAPRATKSAAGAPATPQMVPSGGLFWDGRVDMLMDQAKGPMLNPAEMANKDEAEIVAKLRRAPYAKEFTALFGPRLLDNPDMLFIEAMSALSAYQMEAKAFHRFDSKYDYWLQGQARLTHAEMRGLRLFNDPAKGNCAACHLSQPGKDGLPPMFTDTEYEALGVPRNRRLAVNRDPTHYDMGLCGPLRTDLAKQTQYCGMFLTPTLRNSARRNVYFHNGVYHSLKQVLDFYNLRAVAPERVYPKTASGKVDIYDDLPARYHANIDVADTPFDRKRGGTPPLNDAEMQDIIAFLHTLDDGYRPGS